MNPSRIHPKYNVVVRGSTPTSLLVGEEGWIAASCSLRDAWPHPACWMGSMVRPQRLVHRANLVHHPASRVGSVAVAAVAAYQPNSPSSKLDGVEDSQLYLFLARSHEARYAGRGKDSRPLSRRGFSLMEMLVAASISGVIFLTVAVLLAGVLRTSGRSTAAIERQQTWHRLALAWRGDVHKADNVLVEKAEDGQPPVKVSLSLRRADQSAAAIEYVALPGEIVRRTLGVDQAEALSHESFRIPPDEWSTFSVDNEAGIAVIRCGPAADDEQPKAASRTLEIIAIIGLDRR